MHSNSDERYRSTYDCTINILSKNGIDFYFTEVGSSYTRLTRRGAISCIDFYFNNELYYIYFNTSYNPFAHRMEFSSVSIISADNLRLHKNILEKKWHITNPNELYKFRDEFADVFM